MFIYSNTFENIKTLNLNFPIEDQFCVLDNEAIVADGITKDPVGVFDLSTVSLTDVILKYPRPSGAELAAKEICYTFSKVNGTLKIS